MSNPTEDRIISGGIGFGGNDLPQALKRIGTKSAAARLEACPDGKPARYDVILNKS